MFSGRIRKSNTPLLSSGCIGLMFKLVLLTVLVEFSTASLAEYYMSEFKRSDDTDKCDESIPGGGHCGLDQENCCPGYECKRFNMFFRRWSRCPPTTRHNSYCRCVRVKSVSRRAYPSWDLMDPWSDNSSPYYK